MLSCGDQRSEAVAYVALGANLGDAEAALTSAIGCLGRLESTQCLRASAFYRTPSMGAPGPDYVNAVVELRTRLTPRRLLADLQAIEQAHGRQRSHPNAPRTLDLDILVFGDLRLATPELTLPHPRLHLRAFVLVPLAEIAPTLAIAGLGRVADLLGRVAEQRIDKL